jgi:hypothetical protein
MLEDELKKYQDTTKEIINAINSEDYEKLNVLAESRKLIIDNIKSLKFTKQEFKEIADELDLKKYEDDMNKKLLKKKIDLKHKIESIKNKRKVNSSYNRQNINPMIFSKKI